MVNDKEHTGKPSILSFFLVITVFINGLILFMITAPAGHFDLSHVIRPVDLSIMPEQMNQQKWGDTAVNVDRGEDTEQDLIMELQWKLEDIRVEGNYEIEAYREYEIYKNVQGEIIETRATDHYEYLRYWRYR